VELDGADAEPADESSREDLGSLGPVADEVDDGVAGVVGSPGPRQSFRSYFLNVICSSINSATTSFLCWSLSRNRSDGALEAALAGGVLALEDGGTVLEELRLPKVEECGRQPMLIADVREGMSIK
jgi:hypothetical protein